jgi:hypothetical protein
MRTTLDIDSDVLAAAKEMAAKEKSTAGRIISEVFRRGIQTAGETSKTTRSGQFTMKNGIPLMPSRGSIVTSEHVRKIMDEEGI